MRDMFDMTEIVKLDEGKSERIRLLRQALKKQRNINFKNYRQNNTSRLRAQEISRKTQQ